MPQQVNVQDPSTQQKQRPWWELFVNIATLRIPRARSPQTSNSFGTGQSGDAFSTPRTGDDGVRENTGSLFSVDQSKGSGVSILSTYPGSVNDVGDLNHFKKDKGQDELLSRVRSRQKTLCVTVTLLIIVIVLGFVTVSVSLAVFAKKSDDHADVEDVHKLQEDLKALQSDNTQLQQEVDLLRSQIQEQDDKIDQLMPYINASADSNVTCGDAQCLQGWCGTLSFNGEPRCHCYPLFSGVDCSEAIEITKYGTEVTIAWSDFVSPPKPNTHIRVDYRERAFYPQFNSYSTFDKFITIFGLKEAAAYEVVAQAIDWQDSYTLVTSLDVQKLSDTSLNVSWLGDTNAAEKGYLVQANRRMSAKQGTLKLQTNERNVSLLELEPCTDYEVDIVYANDVVGLGEDLLQRVFFKTECVVAGWVVGHSVVVKGWSGGGSRLLLDTHCNQNDNFLAPVISPSCPTNSDDGRVGEAVTEADAHTGKRCWHYKRGQRLSAHGVGAPYSPELKVKVGRSDGNYSGEADGFYTRLWVKAARADGSRIEIAMAGPLGNDRVSTMVYITADASGLQLNTYDARSYEGDCTIYRNCTSGFVTVPLAENLVISEWHLLEMELRVQNVDYGNEWKYWVDGDLKHTGGSYLDAWFLELDGSYRYVTRMKFRPLEAPDDVSFLGFYFDDIHYRAFNWAAKGITLDQYATSFE